MRRRRVVVFSFLGVCVRPRLTALAAAGQGWHWMMDSAGPSLDPAQAQKDLGCLYGHLLNHSST